LSNRKSSPLGCLNWSTGAESAAKSAADDRTEAAAFNKPVDLRYEAKEV
jgi:hypothetical protein